MPEKKILAKNILNFRKQHHITQFEMAAECGISIELLSLLERQIGNPTLDTMQKIATFIGQSVADLLTDNNSQL